ncbi:MAG: hypothetical protein WCJ58_05300 [bacterium]
MNLTANSIKALTNDRSFIRGEKYYQEGRVNSYHDTDNVLTADVIGTDKYIVQIDLNTLIHSCNCLAFNGDQFCKHEVSVLLTKMSGEIKPKQGIEIKRKNRRNNPQNETNEVPNLIAKLELPELRHLIIEFTDINQDARNYFISKLSKPEEADIKDLEILFRKLFRNIRYSGDWGYYNNRLDEIFQDSLQLFQYLTITKKTCIFLLEQAYWLDKRLTSIDDSDGIIQGLQDELICKALNGIALGELTLSDIYEFTSRDSNFDFATKLIEFILENINDLAYIKPLLEKLEITLYRADKDFGQANHYMKNIFFHFLAKFDPEKFESLALEFYKSDNSIKQDLLDFYFLQKNYTKFVEIYGEFDNLYFWGYEKLEKAFEELHDNEKLMLLYSKLIILGYGKKYLEKLYKIVRNKSGEKGWINFRNNLIKSTPSKILKADLCILTKDYDLAVEILLNNPEKDYTGKIDDQKISDYANKFSIISPKHAIKLFEFLFEEEFNSIKGKKNSYGYILLLSNKLLVLNDMDFLKHKTEFVYQNLPTKKKLIEEFKRILKN